MKPWEREIRRRRTRRYLLRVYGFTWKDGKLYAPTGELTNEAEAMREIQIREGMN